jgi:glucose/mannose-6-phosphate isomerase
VRPGAGLPLAADRLDDAELVEAGDPTGVLRQVASAAAHVRIAVRAAHEAGVASLATDGRPRAIVVAGQGIAGDALDVLCGISSPVQVVSVRGDRLPGWVGAADLVIAVAGADVAASELGSQGPPPAEAVASVAEQAARRGCQMVGIGPASDPLADLVRGPYLPSSAGLWPALTSLLVIAEQLGIVEVGADGYEDAAAALEDMSHRCRPASESFVNPAKSLALDLVGGLPLVWGSRPLGGLAARRYVHMLNDVSKSPAQHGTLPEVLGEQAALLDGPFAPGPEPSFPSLEDPDEGFTLDDPAERPELRLVLLADPAAEDARTAALRGAVRDVADQRGVRVTELATEGDRPLRRLAGLVQLTDYASVYLAIASGIEPGAAAAVGDVTERIA